MSLTKVILIVIGSGVVLFILLLTYTLWPTIRNRSREPALKAFIDKPLSLKSRAFIYTEHKGNFRFFENTLTQESYVEDKLKYDLPVGSVITIHQFKTYKSNAGSGTTDVFALGEFVAPDGKKIEFEYVWGNIDPSLYSRIVSDLPIAPWQDSTGSRIHVEIK